MFRKIISSLPLPGRIDFCWCCTNHAVRHGTCRACGHPGQVG